ncbi:MAG: transcriptional regulator [Chloroflexota bacterium]|nr:MAG: transcriptional regulator [Chloroflexota bacterium]
MQVTRYDRITAGASGEVSAVAYHASVARPPDHPGTYSTPLAAALDRVGDRWSPQIVAALLATPLRYGEVQAAVAGIAPNILADRLRRLEADGLLVATAYAERPPRFEYRLTAEGRALAGALRLLADWGAQHTGSGGGEDGILRHGPCGSALDARWYCPTCGDVVDIDGPDEARRV